MSEVIKISDLTKVEGLGNLTIEIEDNEMRDLRFGIHEGPRYFEAFMRGRHYLDLPLISSRICGICTVVHAVTSQKAVERALGIDLPPEIKMMRDVLLYCSNIQSHVLHLFFLAAPDYMGHESIFTLASDRMDLVKLAFRLKRTSNDITRVLAGRAVHPVSLRPAGFTKPIRRRELERSKALFSSMLEDLRTVVEIFASFEYSPFKRESEQLALQDGKIVPLFDGLVVSKGGLKFAEDEYIDHIQESVIAYANAKRSVLRATGDYFEVGALARLNLNHMYLSEETKELLSKLGTIFPADAIMLNNLAQAVECLDNAVRGIEILEELISRDWEYWPEEQARLGPATSQTPEIRRDGAEGTAICEAPRGMLIHHYRLNRYGRVEWANVITPTSMNSGSIEADLKAYVPRLLEEGRSKEEIILEAEKVIRAYDPCISCSVHLIENGKMVRSNRMNANP